MHQILFKGVQSCFSHGWLFMTLWAVACQAPLSVGLSRQEYWVGCHALLQGISPTQGWNPCLLYLLHWQEGSYHWRHLGSLWVVTLTLKQWGRRWYSLQITAVSHYRYVSHDESYKSQIYTLCQAFFLFDIFVLSHLFKLLKQLNDLGTTVSPIYREQC